MKFNRKIKLIVSSLVLTPFITFSKVNAIQNDLAAQPNVLLTRVDSNEVDPNCWLEVNYETINGVNGIVLNCVFPTKYDDSVTYKDSSDSSNSNNSNSDSVILDSDNADKKILYEHHFIVKKYMDLHYRDNPIDDFKFIIYDTYDNLIDSKKIKSDGLKFGGNLNGVYANILSTSNDENSDDLLKLKPGVYNIYLNSGDETLGVFSNVVI